MPQQNLTISGDLLSIPKRKRKPPQNKFAHIKDPASDVRESYTPEYRAYTHAKERCADKPKKHKSFHNYGGRGIEFRFTSYEEFFACLGRKPTPEHTLDRINNDGHYEPGNVRWASPDEQRWNLRRSVLLTIDGVTKPIRLWNLAVSCAVAYRRLALGWCHKCVATLPKRSQCPHC